MSVSFLLLVVGFVILIKGADFLITGASSLAKKFNISNLAIGLTVVAFGTSAPELVVNLISASTGKTDAAFGNVIGSNIFNIYFILGVAGIICPLVIQHNTIKYEVPISLGAAVLLYILVNDAVVWSDERNMLSRIDALLLLVCFAGFMLYVYRSMAKSGGPDDPSVEKVRKPLVAVALTILGVAMLIGGGKLVVDSAVAIAGYFGLSERLIGLTVLAAGTSLPELATSAVAAYKRSTDIAIGNVIGSNIFNILFILGISGLIQPISFNTALNVDLQVIGIGTIALMIFMFTINTRKLDRWEAVLLFIGYVVYTLYLISMD